MHSYEFFEDSFCIVNSFFISFLFWLRVKSYSISGLSFPTKKHAPDKLILAAVKKNIWRSAQQFKVSLVH